MKPKTFAIVYLTLTAILLLYSSGCEGGGYTAYTTTNDLTQVAQLPAGPTRNALQATTVARYVVAEMAQATAEAAQATSQAYTQQQLDAAQRAAQERAAMTAEAQAVADARASEAAATRQALDAQATAQAIALQATQQVMTWNTTATAEARNATATVESRTATAQTASMNATATATREAATATTQAVLDNAQATMVQATAQAVARANERERVTQPLQTFGPWVLMLLALLALTVLGIYGWRLFEDRARLVRRKPDEGEPLMLITRERVALPLRQFGPYADMAHGQERAPLLAPSVEAQEGATMRQQTANAIQAQQVGQVAQARYSRGQTPGLVVQRQARRAQGQPRPRPAEPGLLDVTSVGTLDEATATGTLPPRLAEAIEARWTEIEEEEEV